MTDSGSRPGLPPVAGSRRKWLEDWAGATTVMVGCAAAAVAFVVRDWLWLWILAPVIVVVGIAIWALAGPGAASRQQRRSRGGP